MSVDCFKPGSNLAGISGVREYIAGRPHDRDSQPYDDKMAWGRGGGVSISKKKKSSPSEII